MAYMKRATTIVLFLLLLGTLGFFAVSVVKYQGDLTRLNDDIRDKRVEIDDLSDQLKEFNESNSQLNEQLTVQQAREQDLSTQYLDVKGEKESLESTNAALEKDLANITSQYTALQIEYNDTTEELGNVLEDAEDICNYSATANITECDDYR
ncbi:TPA: hypothetical protein HA239_01440 [Candidatus Woesearchaeota archaeon]|nr:hypothetical protein QT06_C0001G0889 [archaeon GW2011_AR15]MBS3103333.1 hypothetical protein [Candidatus Woesearchaeota archaeon]HIH41056.1 hypothetical protein [Candidatus Woesearchaeota archaeon]